MLHEKSLMVTIFVIIAHDLLVRMFLKFQYSRYYVIVHPLKAQYLCTVKKAQKTVALTWMVAIILAYPVTMVQVGNPYMENQNIYIFDTLRCPCCLR